MAHLAWETGRPVVVFVRQDHFDRLTCVPDRNGVLRPNPETWTTEIGSWNRPNAQRRWSKPCAFDGQFRNTVFKAVLEGIGEQLAGN